MRSTAAIRRVPALLGAAALLTATLAGCTGAPGSGGCDPAYVSGDASSLVTSTGTFGSAPTVDFPTPLVASKKPEVSTLITGDGAPVGNDAQVDYSFSLYDGKSGDQLGKGGYSADQFARVATKFAKHDEGVSSIGTALQCLTVGSRVAVVTTWADAKNAFSSDASEAVDDAATVVAVIDVSNAYLGKADGFNQLPVDGLPTVSTEVDGTPGVSILAQDAPKTSRSGVIKGGDGAKLKKDAKAVIHYSLWTWPTTRGDAAAQVGTTWSARQAVTLQLTDIADGGGVPTALLKALIGQRVGSQVLVVMPPGDDSFPAGQGPAGDDATYIFVVDILGIQK